MTITFSPAAAADVKAAYLWYERKRTGLGKKFLAAVREAADSLLDNPKRYGIVHRDLRRALVRRFPYSVFYRVTEDSVTVVACFHMKRDPQQWEERE